MAVKVVAVVADAQVDDLRRVGEKRRDAEYRRWVAVGVGGFASVVVVLKVVCADEQLDEGEVPASVAGESASPGVVAISIVLIVVVFIASGPFARSSARTITS